MGFSHFGSVDGRIARGIVSEKFTNMITADTDHFNLHMYRK